MKEKLNVEEFPEDIDVSADTVEETTRMEELDEGEGA